MIMKNISKYKLDKTILIPILIFAFISIITLYGAKSILPSTMSHLMTNQIIWYIAGFILIYLIMTIGNTYIYRISWFLYFVGIISLIGLFFFGKSINNAVCWYEIKGIGTIQPSEFMKIILIIINASMISKFNEEFPNPSIREEFMFLIKVFLVILPPSILTFMQPDTGVVLIYLLITFVMLFISGIRYRWFIAVIAAGVITCYSLRVAYLWAD